MPPKIQVEEFIYIYLNNLPKNTWISVFEVDNFLCKNGYNLLSLKYVEHLLLESLADQYQFFLEPRFSKIPNTITKVQVFNFLIYEVT